MRFKKSPQLPGAGRTRAGHHHGSHTPTSPGAILLSKMACQPKHFGRQCNLYLEFGPSLLLLELVLYSFLLNMITTGVTIKFGGKGGT